MQTALHLFVYGCFVFACVFVFQIQDWGRAIDPPNVIRKDEVRVVYKSKVFCEHDTHYIQTHLTFVCDYGSLVSTALCSLLLALHLWRGGDRMPLGSGGWSGPGNISLWCYLPRILALPCNQ